MFANIIIKNIKFYNCVIFIRKKEKQYYLFLLILNNIINGK